MIKMPLLEDDHEFLPGHDLQQDLLRRHRSLQSPYQPFPGYHYVLDGSSDDHYPEPPVAHTSSSSSSGHPPRPYAYSAPPPRTHAPPLVVTTTQQLERPQEGGINGTAVVVVNGPTTTNTTSSSSTTTTTSPDEHSPDPHEFYRPFQVQPLRTGLAGRERVPIAGAASDARRPLPAWAADLKPTRRTPRPSPPPPSTSTPSSRTVSSSSWTQQRTLKELVQQFSQNRDELLPIPVRHSSRPDRGNTPSPTPAMTQSRTLAPSSARTAARSDPPRPPRQRLTRAETADAHPAPPRKVGRHGQLARRTDEDLPALGRSDPSRPSRSERSKVDPDNNPWATRSMTTLHLAQNESARRPLFGEVLSAIPDHLEAGFGITQLPRNFTEYPRRPSMAHRRTRSHAEVSPTSPNSSHVGHRTRTPPAQGNRVDRDGSPRPRPTHRRAQSDIATDSNLIMEKNGYPPGMTLPRMEERGGINGEMRNSAASPPLVPGRSRIPLSTRRLSSASEGGMSSPGLQSPTSPISATAARELSGSGIPRLSAKHTHTAPSMTVRPITPARTSSRRYNPDPSPTTSNARLKARIVAPLPKQSPPLRGSRQRTPISSATTSPPSSTKPRFSDRSTTGPEEAIDFAARREQIRRTLSQKRPGRRPRGSSVTTDSLPGTSGTSTRKLQPPLEMQPEEKGPRVSEEDRAKVNSNRNRHENDAPVEQGPTALESVPEQPSESNSSLETSDRTDPESHPPEVRAEDLDSPTLGTPGKRRPALNVTVEDVESHRESVQSNITAEDLHAETGVDERSAMPDRHDNEPTVQDTPTMGGLLLPATTFRPGPRSDIGDQESIRIMLEASPVMATLPEKSELPQQVPEEPRPASGSTNRERRLTASPPVPPERSTSRPRPDLHPIFNHDQFHDANDQTDHAATAQAPPAQQEMLDSPSYGAITGVYEQYHDGRPTNPDALRNFQQQLAMGSPELARLGSWDSRRVTQLIFQHLHQQTPSGPSSAETHPPPSHGQHDTNEGLQGYLPSHEAESTDIDSNASELAAEEHRRAYELLESGWSSDRPSLEVDHGTTSTNRASVESRGEWEDASYSIVDWMEPPATSSPEHHHHHHEDPSRLCPTPPPKSPRRSLQLREATDSPPTRSPRRRGDGGGAATPRLPAENQLRLPEITPTGEGLGLTITGHDRNATSTPVLQPPPPLPDYSPPPPPVASFIDDQPYAAINHPGGPRSPPSPSVYSRHPMSRDYTSFAAEQFQSMRTSHLSAQPTEAFTPLYAPATQSSSSSTVREQTVVAELPAEPAPLEMVGTTSTDDPEHRRLNKRRMLIKELLDTEKAFYNDMNIVQEIYRESANMRPHKDANPVLNPDDIKVLFGNGDQVAAFSMDLYDALRPAAKMVYRAPRMPVERTSVSTSNSGGTAAADDASANTLGTTDDDRDRQTFIGAVFAEMLSRMESVYGEYLRNHDAANKRLEKLQSIPRIQDWLAACQAAAHGVTTAWSLDSLLVKPTQRISKYSLILEPLLQATPENHPDYSTLRAATMEMRAVLTRINEMKRRLELVEQVVGRKRKESDVRAGISKALGRRKEKWRQNMGLTESVDDPEFNQVAEKLGDEYFHLQIYMRDTEYYLRDVQAYVDGFRSLVQAIEGHLDVAQSNYTEIESKWRKFGIAVRELSTTALNEHKTAVMMSVVEPLKALIQQYDGPEKAVLKRNKRLGDYARYRTAKDRGEKADKRTQEQGEQFLALNETLKIELPKLYALTGKLAERCLGNFVQQQMVWQTTWQLKMSSILDNPRLESLEDIIQQAGGDLAYTERMTLGLGICNRSFLTGSMNMLSPVSTRFSDEIMSASSSKRPSLTSGRPHATSFNSTSSPGMPGSMEATRSHYHPGPMGGPTSPVFESPSVRPRHASHHHHPVSTPARPRGGSGTSHSGTKSPEMTPAARSFSAAAPSGVSAAFSGDRMVRPNTGGSQGSRRETTGMTGLRAPPPPPLTRLTTTGSTNHTITSTKPPSLSLDLPTPLESPLSARPFSGMFSSAMPMPDSPQDPPPMTSFSQQLQQYQHQHHQHQHQQQSQPSFSTTTSASTNYPPQTDGTSVSVGTSEDTDDKRDFNVLFLAASRGPYEVEASIREGGFGYLSYASGDVFDVVGEKGRLWLARNQDDSTGRIGWIWKRHFDIIPT